MTEPTYAQHPNDVPPTAVPPESRASIWEDFIDIFYVPSQVFDRRRVGGFAKAFFIFWVLAAALFFAARPVMGPILETQMEEQAAKALENQPGMTEEKKAEMISMQRKVGGFFASAGAVIGPPIAILMFTIGTFIVARFVGAKPDFGQSGMIATYASVPGLLGSILFAAQGLMLDTANMRNLNQLMLSPARFMDPDTTSPVLYAFAGRFEVFAIWTAILIGIGIAVVGRVSRARGLTAGAIFWAIATLFTVFGAMRAQAAMG